MDKIQPELYTTREVAPSVSTSINSSGAWDRCAYILLYAFSRNADDPEIPSKDIDMDDVYDVSPIPWSPSPWSPYTDMDWDLWGPDAPTISPLPPPTESAPPPQPPGMTVVPTPAPTPHLPPPPILPEVPTLPPDDPPQPPQQPPSASSIPPSSSNVPTLPEPYLPQPWILPSTPQSSVRLPMFETPIGEMQVDDEEMNSPAAPSRVPDFFRLDADHDKDTVGPSPPIVPPAPKSIVRKASPERTYYPMRFRIDGKPDWLDNNSPRQVPSASGSSSSHGPILPIADGTSGNAGGTSGNAGGTRGSASGNASGASGSMGCVPRPANQEAE